MADQKNPEPKKADSSPKKTKPAPPDPDWLDPKTLTGGGGPNREL
ncbi:hypothetical protein [Micromonospora sp. CPCC 206061]